MYRLLGVVLNYFGCFSYDGQQQLLEIYYHLDINICNGLCLVQENSEDGGESHDPDYCENDGDEDDEDSEESHDPDYRENDGDDHVEDDEDSEDSQDSQDEDNVIRCLQTFVYLIK